jgi:hypothetical protein
MNSGKTLFAPLMELVPWSSFARIWCARNMRYGKCKSARKTVGLTPSIETGSFPQSL